MPWFLIIKLIRKMAKRIKASRERAKKMTLKALGKAKFETKPEKVIIIDLPLLVVPLSKLEFPPSRAV